MTDRAEFAAAHPDLFRPGRFYLTASGPIGECGRLPIMMPRRGVLHKHLGPGRPWLTFDLLELLAFLDELAQARPLEPAQVAGEPWCKFGPACRPGCPLGERLASIAREAGVPYPAALVWIPKVHYPFAYDWEAIANRFGIRWPLASLPTISMRPKPKMPVLVAHAGGPSGAVPPVPPATPTPAIVYAFRIERIEYVPDPEDDGGRQLKRALARALKLKIPINVAFTDRACRQAGPKGAPMP